MSDYKLITLSGVDGCGKSTLAQQLKMHLESNSLPCYLFSHGNKQDSSFVNTMNTLHNEGIVGLLDQSYVSFVYALQYFGFFKTTVLPTLQLGYVIMDRFIFDQYVYSVAFFSENYVNSWTLLKTLYDAKWLCYYLDLSATEADARIETRGFARTDYESFDALKKQEGLYKSLYDKGFFQYKILDASRSCEDLLEIIIEDIDVDVSDCGRNCAKKIIDNIYL